MLGGYIAQSRAGSVGSKHNARRLRRSHPVQTPPTREAAARGLHLDDGCRCTSCRRWANAALRARAPCMVAVLRIWGRCISDRAEATGCGDCAAVDIVGLGCFIPVVLDCFVPLQNYCVSLLRPWAYQRHISRSLAQ